jgi:glutamine---fructose-6-phosphate transaminase (isomerizing)
MTTPAGTGKPRGALLAAEIDEQPAVMQRLLDVGLRHIRDVAEQVRRRRPRFVLLAGRGTSDHAALYAKYLLEIRLGLPCGLVSPSTMTVYRSRPRLDDVWWIAVSQSGASPDLVESTSIAASCGALTLAVTNAATSELAATASHHIDVLAGPERAVAATKSYTAELLALYLLIDAVAGGDGALARGLPIAAADTLARRPAAAEQAARYRFVERLVVTARGYAYPTAREAALKLMETSYLSAHAFSAADLLHGPLAMIDTDRPVIAVVPDGAGARALEPVLDRLAERGADVLAVGDEEVLARWGDRRTTAKLPLPVGVPEEVAPMVQILPLQQVAHALAVARGYDPDAPRGLSKQTLTW